MSVEVVGHFACPVAITAQAVSTALLFASGESYPIFVACIRVAFECQNWKQNEVVAQQWSVYDVVQFYVHPSIVGAKSYGTVTVACDGGFSPFARPRGRLQSL